MLRPPATSPGKAAAREYPADRKARAVFSPVVTEYWNPTAIVSRSGDAALIVIDSDLAANRSVSLVQIGTVRRFLRFRPRKRAHSI